MMRERELPPSRYDAVIKRLQNKTTGDYYNDGLIMGMIVGTILGAVLMLCATHLWPHLFGFTG